MIQICIGKEGNKVFFFLLLREASGADNLLPKVSIEIFMVVNQGRFSEERNFEEAP